MSASLPEGIAESKLLTVSAPREQVLILVDEGLLHRGHSQSELLPLAIPGRTCRTLVVCVATPREQAEFRSFVWSVAREQVEFCLGRASTSRGHI